MTQRIFSHADHLNTPRLVADAAGATVWKWDQEEPFGSNPADENPSELGVFDLPLRLPGQYLDKETNLHYNYFRDYDPSTGRYLESDPIGLKGGLNTYAYVEANPLSFSDPSGLAPRRPGTPLFYCPPAPSGFTRLPIRPGDWGLINKEQCFYLYDPETGGSKLDCYGRGRGEQGTYGWECAVDCRYRHNCTRRIIVIPGKCFISPFQRLI